MNDDTRERLIKLCGMLGSNHDGEVVNAARLAQRLLGAEGVTWEEALNNKSNGNGTSYSAQQSYNMGYAAGYARAQQEERQRVHTKLMTWYAFVRELHDEYIDNLTDWEQGFVESFMARGFARPTPRQRDVFHRIANKLGLSLPA